MTEYIPDRTKLWVYDPFCMNNCYCPSCGLFCHLTIYKENKHTYSYLFQCKNCGLNYQQVFSDSDREIVIEDG